MWVDQREQKEEGIHCIICDKLCKNAYGLANHVTKTHKMLFSEYKRHVLVEVYNGKKFELTSFNQQDITNNLAALEILIHSRVLGIERDIETVEQAFSRFMLPENTDPYSILGLARGASMEVVETVYKKLTLIHHPDRGGNIEDFTRIKDAYETIKEERKGNES